MHRALTVVMATVTAAAMLAGCASDEPEEAAEPTPTSDASATERTPAQSSEPERFDGPVEDFYLPPDPLPEGRPGDLLRVQEVASGAGSSGAQESTWRVMYLSSDTTGRLRPVTGVVTYPTGDPPEGGWPILTTAPGTIGLDEDCALSRAAEPLLPPSFGVEAVRVRTDYIGMGPPGETQAYLSRLSEGHSVLDAARAAQQLEDAGAGDRVLIFGHSQGGHGAQSAHELAATYAPELEVLGTVSGAPASMFETTYGGVDDIVARIVTTMGLYGVATDHPGVDPADYLSDAALETTQVFEEGCLDAIIEAFIPLAVDPGYWKVDPRTTEPARSVLRDNDVGNVAADAPMLLLTGTEDERVVHERVLDLFDRLCDVGQVTELVVLEGANHGTDIAMASDRIGEWFADRLAGGDAVDTCEAVGSRG